MKKYYFFDGTTQHGPFTLDELRTYRITPQTSVWFDSLPQWKPAGEIEELKSLFSAPATTQAAPGPVDLNTKQIYISDGGGAQQGPFTLAQLQGKNITANTLVWYDPLTKWVAASQIPELKNIIDGTRAATTVTTAPQTTTTLDPVYRQYYFLDSAGNQQGPFNSSQLAGKNISAQTAVWYDPLSKWTTAGQVPELKSILVASHIATTTPVTTVAPVQEDLSTKQFYFADGSGIQQGPFTLAQLHSKNITATTLVWYDPLTKWVAASQIPGLKDIIDKVQSSAAASPVSTPVQTTTKEDDISSKQFFFADSSGTQHGPFTLKQLEDKGISGNTAIWYDPLPEWTTAEKVPALKAFIDATKAKTDEWNNKLFFFTDASGARQGPFKLQQLKEKNISPDTPIWYSPLAEWTTAGKIPALKDVISNPTAAS